MAAFPDNTQKHILSRKVLSLITSKNRYYQVTFHDNAQKQVLSWKGSLDFLLMSGKDIPILHSFCFIFATGSEICQAEKIRTAK
jgi:hypothetical protein